MATTLVNVVTLIALAGLGTQSGRLHRLAVRCLAVIRVRVRTSVLQVAGHQAFCGQATTQKGHNPAVTARSRLQLAETINFYEHIRPDAAENFITCEAP